jgi:hypothetical protein
MGKGKGRSISLFTEYKYIDIYTHTHFFSKFIPLWLFVGEKENSQKYLKELAWAFRALPKIEIHNRKFPQSIYLFGNKFQGHEFHQYSQLILLIFCEFSNVFNEKLIMCLMKNSPRV